MWTIIVTMLFYLFRRQKLDELIYHLFEGGNELMAPIGMLILVWALSATAEQWAFRTILLPLLAECCQKKWFRR
nr:hypothetical protein [Anoxybacillus sp. PDR2]